MNKSHENHVSPRQTYLYLDLMKKVDKEEIHGFWMGANDIVREGSYIWLDGSEGKFTYVCIFYMYTFCGGFYWRLKHNFLPE